MPAKKVVIYVTGHMEERSIKPFLLRAGKKFSKMDYKIKRIPEGLLFNRKEERIQAVRTSLKEKGVVAVFSLADFTEFSSLLFY